MFALLSLPLMSSCFFFFRRAACHKMENVVSALRSTLLSHQLKEGWRGRDAAGQVALRCTGLCPPGDALGPGSGMEPKDGNGAGVPSGLYPAQGRVMGSFTGG